MRFLDGKDSRLGFFVFVAFVVCCAKSAAVAATNIDVIISGLKHTEKAVRGLSVTEDADVTQNYPRNLVKPAQYKSHIDVTIDFDGRLRAEEDGHTYRVEKNEEPLITPRVSISTFNGTEERTLVGMTKARMIQGMITSDRSNTFWTLDPRLMTTWYFDHPISQLITEGKGSVIGSEKHDDQDMLIVETMPFTNPESKSKWKQTFWVDPNRNFAVLRRSQSFQFADVDRWMENDRIIGYEYRQIETGIWLPMRVVEEAFGPTLEDAQNNAAPRLMWRYDIRNSNWVVNPKVDDAVFTLQFPKGVNVEDQTVHTQGNNSK